MKRLSIVWRQPSHNLLIVYLHLWTIQHASNRLSNASGSYGKPKGWSVATVTHFLDFLTAQNVRFILLAVHAQRGEAEERCSRWFHSSAEKVVLTFPKIGRYKLLSRLFSDKGLISQLDPLFIEAYPSCVRLSFIRWICCCLNIFWLWVSCFKYSWT